MDAIPPDDRPGAGEDADPEADEQVKLAEAEAASIGGTVGDESEDPALRPVIEGGGGEAEGFEQAEDALIEHASHGDQQSAHAVLHHQGRREEVDDTDEFGEADHEHSSETERDQRS
jgi:hypothetical protein